MVSLYLFYFLSNYFYVILIFFLTLFYTHIFLFRTVPVDGGKMEQAIHLVQNVKKEDGKM